MKRAWLADSRIDILYDVSQFTQVLREHFNTDLKRIQKEVNEAIQVVNKHSLALEFPKLDTSSLQVLGVSDASFATNADLTSRPGYVMFLSDRSGAV